MFNIPVTTVGTLKIESMNLQLHPSYREIKNGDVTRSTLIVTFHVALVNFTQAATTVYLYVTLLISQYLIHTGVLKTCLNVVLCPTSSFLKFIKQVFTFLNMFVLPSVNDVYNLF